MVTLRLLVVLVVTVLLTGCLYRVKPPCAPPGAVQTTNDCYYLLQITKIIDPTKGEVLGQVPRQVVEENQIITDSYNGWQWGGNFFRRLVSGGTETYAFFQYQFQIQEFDSAKIVEDSKHDFRSVAGQRALLLGAPSNVKPRGQMSRVENRCLPPGQPATQKCYYKLTITTLDATNGSATGRVPKSVVKQNAKAFPYLATLTYDSQEYTFHVRGIEKLSANSDYDFVSVPNSDNLEVCAKPDCEEYFPRQK